MQQLAAAVNRLPPAARLPLVDLTNAGLEEVLAGQQYAQFRQVVEALVAADGKVDLFEYLPPHRAVGLSRRPFRAEERPGTRYRTSWPRWRSRRPSYSRMLAYVGQQNPADVERAFRCGAGKLLPEVAILPREQCTLQTLDAALAELAQAVPAVKRDLIAAVTACIAADGKVTIEESELLRAIAASLACPIPPIRFAAAG